MKKLICLTLCLLLTVCLTLSACSEKPALDKNEQTILLTDGTVYGEGEKSFTFVVSAKDAEDKTVTVKTDAATVGEALTALNLIAGEDGEYGLYVKTVDGITADYDKDGTYWAFYIDGEYAMTGVDATEITEGATYQFKIES